MQIHITLGVDTANLALTEMHRNISALDEKLNLILLFRRLETPREKELLAIIESQGGVKACLNTDENLKELAAAYQKQKSSAIQVRTGGQASLPKDGQTFFAELRTDLKKDILEDLNNNMASFERKLEIQKEQIISSVTAAVHREGDRVITAFASGPHDRLKDPVSGWKNYCRAFLA